MPDVADRLVAGPLVDDVLADQHFAGPGLERVEVDVPAAQPGAVAVDLGDPMGVDEDAPTLAVGDEPDDAWRGAGPTGNGDDVGDPADGGAAGVQQRQPHHAECVDEVTGHAAEATGRRSPLLPTGVPSEVGCIRGCAGKPRTQPSDGAAPRSRSRRHTSSMAFGQAAGPPATGRQIRDLLELVLAAGHADFRDARGPLGLTQRQAGGKFTRDEADALIDLLRHQAETTDDDGPARTTEPAHRLSATEQAARALPAEVLAAELQRRGWVVMEP